jgi:putative ABC transport system permease protein
MSMVPECRMGDQAVVVVVREFSANKELPIALKSGNLDTLRQQLSDGEVVIGTVLSQRTGKSVGDEIELGTREGVKRLRVAGTTNAYMVGGLVVYMEGAIARKLLGVSGVDVFIIEAQPGRQAAAEGSLKKICEQRGLMLTSFAELRGALDAKLNGVVGGLWGLLALLFVVAAFGIANTLTINVLEQTRDLALLRVVAMTRRQVRKTILAQAAIIGLIGLITGTVGGLIGAFIINLCSFALLGRVVDFVLQPTLLGVCFGLGLVVVLVAAWLPAERAARLNLLLALQYE